MDIESNSTGQNVDDIVDRANSMFLLGRYEEALSCYMRVLDSKNKNPHFLCNLATTLMQLGQLAEAHRYFEMSLAIFPKNLAALNNLAALLGRLGEKEDALNKLLSLAELTPDDFEILSNIGVALNRLERQSEALKWFRQALEINPKFADAHYGLAGTYAHFGDYENAIISCDAAIEFKPNYVSARLLKLMLTLPVVPASIHESECSINGFKLELAGLKAWCQGDPHNLRALGEVVGDRQPFIMAYRPLNIKSVLSDYGDLISQAAKSYWLNRGLLPIFNPPCRNRVRLAILNEQIQSHSVWDIILKGVVKNIDRNLFEIIIYHTGKHVDRETQWAASCVDKFVSGPKGHAEWLGEIREDAPDILFLPEIGMDPLTCKLAALRLAPLQVASWGHPVTTGLPEIDLFFSGELLESSSADEHYREKLVRLPGTGACTEAVSANATPVSNEILHLPENRSVIRMIICQRPFKLDPAFDVLLAKVVMASWPCKIYLATDTQFPWASSKIHDRIATVFKQNGLSPDDCLIDIPWLSREQFFGMLDEMDVYLDMPAFSGYTTAWQAVHRGIPIVTLEGEFMRQRLAAGLLRKIEQTETIAQTEEEYIEIAARLAQECRDPELRAKRRAAIKAAAPKADHDVSVVRAFEKTLIEELAARGCTFDFVDQTSETTTKTADPAAATQESTMMNTENNQAAYPWQMLDADLHLHTLTPNYAPTGLLAMLPEHADETRRLKVLDVGCFCGGSGRWIKQKFPGAEVIGIEMLPKAAEVAAPDYDKVIVSTFENVNFEVEGLNHGSVDAIIAADVLEHLYNPWQALQRLKPLLAPGGAIYISLPNIRNLNILNALAKGEWQYAGAGILDVTHIRFFTKKQALEMLAQTGWQATEIRINPDSRLMPAFEGKDLSQIQNIELDNLKLTGLSQEDVLELLALQLFIRAEPK